MRRICRLATSDNAAEQRLHPSISCLFARVLLSESMRVAPTRVLVGVCNNVSSAADLKPVLADRHLRGCVGAASSLPRWFVQRLGAVTSVTAIEEAEGGSGYRSFPGGGYARHLDGPTGSDLPERKEWGIPPRTGSSCPSSRCCHSWGKGGRHSWISLGSPMASLVPCGRKGSRIVDDLCTWRHLSTTILVRTSFSADVPRCFVFKGGVLSAVRSAGCVESIGLRHIFREASSPPQSRAIHRSSSSAVASTATSRESSRAGTPTTRCADFAHAEKNEGDDVTKEIVRGGGKNKVFGDESLKGSSRSSSSSSSGSFFWNAWEKERREVVSFGRNTLVPELSALVPRLTTARLCFGTEAGAGLPGGASRRGWRWRSQGEGKGKPAAAGIAVTTTLDRVSQQIRRVFQSTVLSAEDSAACRVGGWWGRESEGKLENVVGGGHGGVDEAGKEREEGEEEGYERKGGAEVGSTKIGPESGKPSSSEELLKDRQLHGVLMQSQSGLPKSCHVAMKKTELAADTSLALRDLRVIDSSFHNQLPSILARSAAIVVNMGYVKSIILKDKVYVFDQNMFLVRKKLIPELQARLVETGDPATNRDSSASCIHEVGRVNHTDFATTKPCVEQQQFFGGRETAWLQGSGSHLPFEMRMLECMLENVIHGLKLGYVELGPEVAEVLGLFVKAEVQEVFIEDQRRLLRLRNRLLRFHMKVNQISTALKELLANDEDMAQLYLTRKAEFGGEVQTDQHSEVEELIENYYKQVEEVVNEVETMLSTIDATGEYLRTVLDSLRNELIRMDVMLNMTTCALAAGGVIAGVFGMNLLSTVEHHPYAFYVVSSSIFLVSTSIFTSVYRYARSRKIM